MPSWPFTKLHVGPQYTIAISGPIIQLINSEDGQILHTSRGVDNNVVVTSSAIGKAFECLVTIGDDKKMKVWNVGVAGLQLASTREVPKKATQVNFVEDGSEKTIVVADKFGDVFKYPVVPRETDTPATSGRESLASHENPHGDLVLGHASIITCFTFSADGRYIITADRDEHIRASRFPLGYIIERYCLGHKQFISAIKIPPFKPSILLSGGGDPYVSVWNWYTGEEKCQIPILEAVEPYLRNTSSRSKLRKKNADSQPPARRRPSKKKRELAEELEVERSIGGHEEFESVKDVDDNQEENPDQAVLVVKKIETLQVGEDQFILFSAVGGSALFYCRFTENPKDIPDVKHLDLHKPILDFVLTLDNRILVAVDVNWSTLPDVAEEMTKPVLMVEFKDDKLRPSDTLPSLVETLNGPALQEATVHEIAALGLYDDLVWLPKRPDGPDEDEAASRPSTPVPVSTLTSSSSSVPTGKMAARLKKKSQIRQHQGGTENDREMKKMKLTEGTEDMNEG